MRTTGLRRVVAAIGIAVLAVVVCGQATRVGLSDSSHERGRIGGVHVTDPMSTQSVTRAKAGTLSPRDTLRLLFDALARSGWGLALLLAVLVVFAQCVLPRSALALATPVRGPPALQS